MQRVAKQYLVPETRTVVYTDQPVRHGTASGRRRANEDALICLSLLLRGIGVARRPEVRQRQSSCLPTRDLKYPPLPPLKVPEPVEITLSNGMKVLLLEDHELPLVSAARR